MQHLIPVTLSETDRASLQTFIHADKASARVFARAYARLKAAEGWTDAQICDAFDVSRNTSIKVRRAYLEGGLDAVLYEVATSHVAIAASFPAPSPAEKIATWYYTTRNSSGIARR